MAYEGTIAANLQKAELLEKDFVALQEARKQLEATNKFAHDQLDSQKKIELKHQQNIGRLTEKLKAKDEELSEEKRKFLDAEATAKLAVEKVKGGYRTLSEEHASQSAIYTDAFTVRSSENTVE